MFDVELSYAVISLSDGHGCVHVPLRNILPSSQFVGLLHGVDSSSPQTLTFFVYVHLPPPSSSIVTLSFVLSQSLLLCASS